MRARVVGWMALAVAAGGGLVSLWATGRTTSEVPAPLPDEVLGKLTGKHWYRVSLMGQPSGWAMYETWLQEGGDGTPRLTSRQRLHFQVELNGQKLSASSETLVETDGHLRPIKITMAADELGREKTVLAEVEGTELAVTVSSGGRASRKRLPLPEDWGSDLQFAAKAARGALHPGETFTVSIFDPEVADFDRHHIAVTDVVEAQMGGQTRRLFCLDDTTERLKLKIRTFIDADGVMWRQEAPGVMNLVLEKVGEAEAMRLGRPLSLSNRVAVDKPLGEPQGVATLRLRVTLDRPAEEPPFPTTARQTVTALSDTEYELSVKAASPPKTIANRTAKLPQELAGLTSATGIAEADDQRMRELAERITAGKGTAWEAAQAIVRWVYENMRKVASEPRPVTALECLDNMVGDCTEHALLAGTLARAAGLPSKMCVGLGYTGDAFYYHAWVKIWVGEWVEMDPTWGEATVDATHLQVAEGALDEPSMARMSLATARILGQVSFRVLDVRRSATE